MSASGSLHTSRTLTSLELIGGRDASPGRLLGQQSADLWVKGGGIFEKSICVLGNISIGEMVLGDVRGNIYTSLIVSEELSNPIEIYGDTIIQGNLTVFGESSVSSQMTYYNDWTSTVFPSVSGMYRLNLGSDEALWTPTMSDVGKTWVLYDDTSDGNAVRLQGGATMIGTGCSSPSTLASFSSSTGILSFTVVTPTVVMVNVSTSSITFA